MAKKILPKKEKTIKKIKDETKKTDIIVENKDAEFDFTKYNLELASIKKLREDWIAYRGISFTGETHCTICGVTCTTCQGKTHCNCGYPTSLIVYANIINRTIKGEDQPYNVQRIMNIKPIVVKPLSDEEIAKKKGIVFKESGPMSQCPYCGGIKMYCPHFTNGKY